MQSIDLSFKESGDSQGMPSESQSTSSPYPWIINPVLDYLFVSGGMLWILWGLSYLGLSGNKTDPASTVFGIFLFYGSLLITDTHGPATLARVFTSKTTPGTVKKVVIAAALLVLALAIPSLSSITFAQAFTKLTLLWAIQHYTAQTYGVVMIYCLKRQFTLSALERLVIQNMLRAQLIFVLVRAFTIPQFGQINFLGLDLPFWGPLPIGFLILSQFLLVLMGIFFVITFAYRAFSTKQILPLPAVLSIITVISLTLLSRDNIHYFMGVTFYHSSQYLSITYSYFLKEQALQKNLKVSSNGWNQVLAPWSLIYYMALLAVGYVISFKLPDLLSLQVPAAIALCTVYSVFNCHHFFTDALVWRIRDNKVRQLLV